MLGIQAKKRHIQCDQVINHWIGMNVFLIGNNE
jgi:hypothetical protein